MDAAAPKVESSNLLVILGILIVVALIGIFVIYFIVKRGIKKEKCTPDTLSCKDLGSDGLPQVPYCSSDDSNPNCEDSSKVCTGEKPDGSTCDMTTLYCDYKTKKWSCTGTPGKKPSGTTYCSITGNTLQYPVYNGSTLDTATSAPDPNYDKYTYVSIAGRDGCQLTSCKGDFKPYTSKDASNKDVIWCAPNDIDGIPCDTSKFVQLKGDTHDYTDKNATWRNAYILDTYTKYCQFASCTKGTLTGTTCVVSPDGGGCGELPDFATGWAKDCTITGCNNTPGATLQWSVSPDKKSCVPMCNPDAGTVQAHYTYGFDKGTMTCKPNGCMAVTTAEGASIKYNWNGTSCAADCKDGPTASYFLLGHPTFPASYVNAVPSSDGNTCVPDPSFPPPWGGCGSPTNPGFALSSDKTKCEPTINSQVAKFNPDTATDGSTPGCLMCQPRICYPWATKDNYKTGGCSGTFEDNCIFTGASLDGNLQDAVSSCTEAYKNNTALFQSGFDGFSNSLKDFVNGKVVGTSGQAVRKYKYTIQTGSGKYIALYAANIGGAVTLQDNPFYFSYNTFTQQINSFDEKLTMVPFISNLVTVFVEVPQPHPGYGFEFVSVGGNSYHITTSEGTEYLNTTGDKNVLTFSTNPENFTVQKIFM